MGSETMATVLNAVSKKSQTMNWFKCKKSDKKVQALQTKFFKSFSDFQIMEFRGFSKKLVRLNQKIQCIEKVELNDI